MRKYKPKKSYIIFCSAITALFYTAAIFALVYFALGGIKNWVAYIALILLFMAVPVLFTYFCIVNFSTHFIFYDDAFEYHTFRNFVTIKAKNIRFFYYREGTLTIFFTKDKLSNFTTNFNRIVLVENSTEKQLALQEDEEIFKLSISAMGFIKDSEMIIKWFSDHIEVMPDGQALKDYTEIIEKYNPSPEDLGCIMEKAEKIASHLNFFAVAVSL